MNLQVRVLATPDSLTVRLAGELDVATGELLDSVLRNRAGRRFVRLDLGRLTFLDCAGLRTILAAHERLRARSGRLVLIHVGDRHRRLLRLTRLDEVLFVADGGPGRADGAAHA